MKNILKTFKPNITKRLISPIIKNQSNQVDALENEILKSFKHMNRVFNLKNPVPKKQESDTISLKDFESKYLKASDNEIDQIIQVIYKEEVKNIKEAKLFDKLVLFIRNCKKYNYPQYLTDVKYFKNKEIQNFMLNTNLLETLSNKKSKYSVANDFAIKFKVQSLYNLRKGEKGEKLDPVTEKDFEMLNYDYMNYLAETSRMEKIHKLEEVKQHNEKILEDYHSGNNAMETKEQLIVTDQSWQQHYIDYAMKIKKAERKESMGLSKFEEPFYEEALRQGESYVQAESQVNYSFIKKNKEREREQQKDKADDIEDQNEGTFGSDGTRFTNTSSTQLKYGFNEPYPYHGVEDYNDEEVMDDQKYFPGKILSYSTLDEYGKYDPIPPKLEEYFEDFRMKTHMWNLFTFIPHYKHDIAMVYTNINNFFSGKIKDSSKDTQLPTSLLHYYYLLPRWARDHPTMKMIIRGLEYSQPFMSLREKIILVNIGLHIIMGKDDNFTEILTDINETRKENITMENIQELISYKDDERLNVQEATDYATDDEDELDNSYTEADYREEERLEEKLRKEQKKEEGRKKRAEAEAKELAASGKIDKEAEEKKKKEEAEKKKKAAAAAANEIAEEPEEEEETSQDSEKTEEKQAKESENLSPFKHRNKHKRSRVDAEEKVIDIYEQVNDLKNQTDDFVVDQPVVSKSAAEDLDFEDEGEDAGETSEVKDEETDTVTQEKEVSRFENDSELQKSKVANLLIELKNVNNPKYIEGRLVNIRKELQIRMQEKFSYHLTKAGLISSEEIDKFKLEDSLNDSSIIPVSLYLSPILKEMHKEIIKNVFRITKEDIERYSPYAIILEEEYLIQQEKAKIIFSLAVTDKREIDPDEVDYKDSYNSKLSEDVVEVGDDEDEMGMKDVYYKPPRDYTIRLRTFDPVSFDYYINEDGFWNTYIDEKKKLANVKDFIYKPFIERKNMIQRKKQTDEF